MKSKAEREYIATLKRLVPALVESARHPFAYRGAGMSTSSASPTCGRLRGSSSCSRRSPRWAIRPSSRLTCFGSAGQAVRPTGEGAE
jgi:hypothetical protein